MLWFVFSFHINRVHVVPFKHSLFLTSSNRNFIIIRQVKCEKCYDECNCKLIEAIFIIAMQSIVWAGSGEVCSMFNVQYWTMCALVCAKSFFSYFRSFILKNNCSHRISIAIITIVESMLILLQSYQIDIAGYPVQLAIFFIVVKFWMYFLMSNSNRNLRSDWNGGCYSISVWAFHKQEAKFSIIIIIRDSGCVCSLLIMKSFINLPWTSGHHH